MQARGLVITLVILMLAAAGVAPAQDSGSPESTGTRPDGSSAAAPADAPGSPGAPVVDVVATGLDAPVAFALGPDGTLYYGEWRTGHVYAVDDGGRPVKDGGPVVDLTTVAGDVSWGDERGFVGLAIDADGFFYAFHTVDTPDHPDAEYHNLVTKWSPEGEYVATLAELWGSNWHNAGRLWVDDAADVLWIAYGDVNRFDIAQDTSHPAGSLLRMTLDGEPAPGNVEDGSLIWSYGHRQPYGFAVDPESGRVMAAENMNEGRDEVNLVAPGGNHGWPDCEGPCDPPREDFVDPVIYYESPIGPTTGAFFRGDFYFGDFNFGHLHRVYEHDGQWFDEIVHAADEPPILHVVTGPEGNTIYFSTWTEIKRLTFDELETDPDGPDLGDGNGKGNEPDDWNGGSGEGLIPRVLSSMAVVGVAVVVGVAALVLARRGGGDS